MHLYTLKTYHLLQKKRMIFVTVINETQKKDG